MRYRELPLASHTAYAELAEQARAFEISGALTGLTGSFQKLARKGRAYWYFAYRDLDGKVRMVYVDPDEDRVRALVERFKSSRKTKPLAPQARSTATRGTRNCASTSSPAQREAANQ